jgi:hypothetical protein
MFTLENDYELFIPELIGIDFQCKKGSISYGFLKIYTGYTWDGCTCAINTNKTYYPCLIHDFFCEFNPIDRDMADAIFLKLLEDKKFELSYIYYVAVRFYYLIKKQIKEWLN